MHLSIHVFSPNKSKFWGHSLLLHTPLAHIRSHGLFCSPYMELRVGKRGTQHVRKDLQSSVSRESSLCRTLWSGGRVMDTVVLLMSRLVLFEFIHIQSDYTETCSVSVVSQWWTRQMGIVDGLAQLLK